MMTWLLAPHNVVFAAAFVALICFALLEGISLLLGLGLSDFLSDLLGLPDGDVSGEASTGIGNPVLAWLEIGKMPLLVSLCAFLAAFSISGMLLQQALILAGPGPLVNWAAAGIAFLVALPALKMSNRVLGRILPQDETSSFSAELLVGRVGVVTIGTASADRAAEVKVIGPDGRSHYLMTYVSGDSVPQGGEVLLERRDDRTGHYYGVLNINSDLSPDLYL